MTPPDSTDSEPLPKVVHDLVMMVHRLRDAGLNHEEIMAALRAHKAKQDQAKASTPIG